MILLKERGFILNAYGSIDFMSIDNLFKNDISENLNDNFKEDFQIKDVQLDTSSSINLKNRQNINAKFISC